MADSCAQYVNADDLKAAKESIAHIEHVATSKDANGNPALVVTDPIRGVGYTNATLDGLFSDIGFKPVNGSFEDGGTLVNRWEVLLYETNGSSYQWLGELPHTVPAGSSPFDSSGHLLTGWVDQTDLTLRADLAKPSGTDNIGYGTGTLTDYIRENNKHTAKTIINVSAFGNTGTEQNGSDEAWNNAFAYARTICPMYTNPGGQSWYDLSNFEFVSDNVVYPKTPIKFRTTYGLTISFPIKLPNDFTGDYAIDASLDAGVTPNRDPLYTKIYSNIDCRYVASGIYANGFLHFLYYGVLIKYLTWGVRTGTSGNEFMLMPGSAILQRQYSGNGDADFPANVTTGTGVYIQSGDAKILGCIIAYYKLRGVRIEGPSCFIGSATHIYAAGRQSILQGTNGGNLNITGCWLDSSFVQLDAGNADISNCSIYLTQSSDSVIGITCGASASNIRIYDNSFLGWTGGTPVYFNKGVFGDKTIASYLNRFASGMQNTDVITTLAMSVVGESTAGTVTMDPSSGFTVTYDGVYVNFTATIRWSSFTGGTGAIGVYGLPFVADRISVLEMQQFSNNTNFANCTAVKHTSGTSLRFVNPAGANVLANAAGVDNAYIVVSGKYRPV